ncbi:MAG: DUF4215 domain-containing protein [Polyangiaceae bacterium]
MAFGAVAVAFAFVGAGCGDVTKPSGFDGTTVPGRPAEVVVSADAGGPGRTGEDSSVAPTDSFGTLIEAGPPPAVCGNGNLEKDETCDDGNVGGQDGCGPTCLLESGWRCDVPGVACLPYACGDGIVVGTEDCDDGNSVSDDGCSSVCTLEEGFACPVIGTRPDPCFRTTCGDGKREGTEQCDDGALRPNDGCSPTCTKEPDCSGASCVGSCGDGIKFANEACDDGNLRSGDGCSDTCALEAGYACQDAASGLPPFVDVPVVYRDFSKNHPDFEHLCCGAVTGIAKPLLGANGKPELLATHGLVTSAATFVEWYTDVPAVNRTFYETMRLSKQPDDSYVYDNPSFFPLNGRGFGNEGNPTNFHFTSEVHSWFTYRGGEVLRFRGDDDVFVFINKRLAVDLGGLHPALDGSVTLDATAAQTFGLVPGNVYEFAVFHAERHTNESSYKLTIKGFDKVRTTCAPICGDGLKTKYEACDDGVNAGGYGKCAPGCVLGPRCGDGVVQAEFGEQCDDGNTVDGDRCPKDCHESIPR